MLLDGAKLKSQSTVQSALKKKNFDFYNPLYPAYLSIYVSACLLPISVYLKVVLCARTSVCLHLLGPFYVNGFLVAFHTASIAPYTHAWSRNQSFVRITMLWPSEVWICRFSDCEINRHLSTLMLEKVVFAETSVHIYETSQPRVLEDVYILLMTRSSGFLSYTLEPLEGGEDSCKGGVCVWIQKRTDCFVHQVP